MAKSDIKSAFWLLPVHPDCHHLLGFKVDGLYYYDLCMPMGCAISCAYFEKFSSFPHWALEKRTTHSSILHYLDDFLFAGPSGSQVCRELMDGFSILTSELGVPIALEKSEGPATRMTCLGIELDSADQVSRLPTDKVLQFRESVAECLASKKVSLLQAQRLLGQLNFATRVIPMGRVFSRRLARGTSGLKMPHHRVRLGACIKADLRVWREFLKDFNGVSMWQDEERSNTDLQLFTDAAGSAGFGIILGRKWCAKPWPEDWRSSGLCENINFLELFPILAALGLWGRDLANKRVVFRSDNQAVVWAINNQSASCPHILRLLRGIVLRCLQRNITCSARHVPGESNVIADALSRFKFKVFRKLAPLAEENMCPFPEDLWRIGVPD